MGFNSGFKGLILTNYVLTRTLHAVAYLCLSVPGASKHNRHQQ